MYFAIELSQNENVTNNTAGKKNSEIVREKKWDVLGSNQ